MAGNRHLARRNAVQALYQWDLTGQAIRDIESHFIADHAFEGIDVHYFRELIRGVPLHSAELDAQLAPHLDRELAAVDPVERAILRLGAYELGHEPGVPLRVVIDEAVELAKMFAGDNSYRFVNGVLDKLGAALRGADGG